MPGIVVYVRIDGGFSVWDPARNYWRSDKDRPAAYHFSADAVWDGLDVNGQRVCEGLERDWVNWQNGRKPQFKALENALRDLSPPLNRYASGRPDAYTWARVENDRHSPSAIRTCLSRWPRQA
ncbi:hypothetical protein THH46_27205 [Pseudomonas sp. NA13]